MCEKLLKNEGWSQFNLLLITLRINVDVVRMKMSRD